MENLYTQEELGLSASISRQQLYHLRTGKGTTRQILFEGDHFVKMGKHCVMYKEKAKEALSIHLKKVEGKNYGKK